LTFLKKPNHRKVILAYFDPRGSFYTVIIKSKQSLLIPIRKRFDVFAEIDRLSGKAGAAGWVETLPVATNAASEPVYPVPQGCAGF
jgi:hypothetical protein